MFKFIFCILILTCCATCVNIRTTCVYVLNEIIKPHIFKEFLLILIVITDFECNKHISFNYTKNKTLKKIIW